MRRDMDYVREILIKVGNADGPVQLNELIDDRHDRKAAGYHVSILSEAGLVNASIRPAGDDPYYWCAINSLTWAGNDFLDAVESDAVWKKVTTAIGKSVHTAAFEVVKAVAVKVAEAAIMAQL